MTTYSTGPEQSPFTSVVVKYYLRPPCYLQKCPNLGNKLCSHPAIRAVIEVSMKWAMPMRERLSYLLACGEGELWILRLTLTNEDGCLLDKGKKGKQALCRRGKRQGSVACVGVRTIVNILTDLGR